LPFGFWRFGFGLLYAPGDDHNAGDLFGLLLMGLMSDYLFGLPADKGSWWAKALYTVMPIGNCLGGKRAGRGKVDSLVLHWKACGYTIAYIGAAVCVALSLFQDRELT